MALVADLDALGIEAPPLLRLQAPARVEAVVGEPLALPLTPNLPGEARYRLRQGPEGLEVRGAELVWTAGAEQLGRHTCSVEAQLDGLRAYAQVELEVVRRGLRLPLEPRWVALDPRGRRAAVAGARLASGAAAFDLESGREVARLSPAGEGVILGVALGDRALFCASHDQREGTLLRLDLETGERVEAPLGAGPLHHAEPCALAALDDGGVLVVSGRPGVVRRFDAALRPRGEPWTTPDRGHDPLLLRGPDAWHLGPLRLDRSSGELRAWCGPLNALPADALRARASGQDDDPAYWEQREADERSALPWGPAARAAWSDLPRDDPQRAQSAQALLAEHPYLVRAGYEASEDADGQEVRREVWAETVPLLPGDAPGRVLLARERCRRHDPAEVRVAAGDRRAVVSYRSSLFVLEPPARAAAPLAIVPECPPRVLASDGPPVTLRLRHRGPSQARFTLGAAVPGVRLGPAGALEVDPQAVWQATLAHVAAGVASGDYARRAPDSWSRERAAGWDAPFASRFGEPLDGRFPLVVPLLARVEAGAQAATLWANVVVVGPWPEVATAASRGRPAPAASPAASAPRRHAHSRARRRPGAPSALLVGGGRCSRSCHRRRPALARRRGPRAGRGASGRAAPHAPVALSRGASLKGARRRRSGASAAPPGQPARWLTGTPPRPPPARCWPWRSSCPSARCSASGSARLRT
ncbi:MAG: hypothetical protein R3F62_09115 [Planctomycetota bacterium]